MIATSPTITEEFDCSADSQFISASGGTADTAHRRGRQEADFAVTAAHPAALRQPGHDRVDEFGQRESVGQQTDAGAAAHARQCKLRRQRGGGSIFPDDAQRQQPARGAGLRVGLDLRQQQVRIRQRRQQGRCRYRASASGPSWRTSGAWRDRAAAPRVR